MTSSRPLKGMVLAAGFGTRLKPFTEGKPKPLFPFFGVSLLDLGLFRLRNAGINTLSANAHHLPQELEAALLRSPLGQDVVLSKELPEILGRGGAFAPLKSWRAGADLLVYNGDIASDVDVSALIRAHETQQNVATMMLLPKPLSRDAAVYRIDDRVLAISKTAPDVPGATAHGFACLHILSDEFLHLLPQSGVSDVLDGYRAAFAKGLAVGSVIHKGFWHGIESPQNAWDAHMDLLQRGFGQEETGVRQVYKIRGESFNFFDFAQKTEDPATIVGPVFIGPRCKIAADAFIGPQVILSGDVVVGANSHIKNALLLNGVRVAAGESIENAVVGFNGEGQQVAVPISV